MKKRCAGLLWFCLIFTAPLFAENWPAWRGANGLGITSETNLPRHWSTTENVRWKIPLPEPGNSTPIVWQNKIFITQALKNQRLIICFDRATGKQLWQSGVTY
ncbi:MAG: PQQ-like beta-propeller repeat protein, partial [Verrucomicrobiota bacterium]|nr:PQQ-like beta-propeller repeat protein [Verrucomicrobiota bacterium]